MGESREAHVGSQSADTIKLNFINLILESISVRAAPTNRPTDRFSNDSRGVFERASRGFYCNRSGDRRSKLNTRVDSLHPLQFFHAASAQSLSADGATCVDGPRTVAHRAVTLAAAIPEDGADSPASSEYFPRHRRARTGVRLIQRSPSLSLRALEATSENFSCCPPWH